MDGIIKASEMFDRYSSQFEQIYSLSMQDYDKDKDGQLDL
jgi:hypothetical protein